MPIEPELYVKRLRCSSQVLSLPKRMKKMSLGDIMCKYKHIGTDMAIRPYT